MEAIKKQIDALIVYKSETLDELIKDYDNLNSRIIEGINKMRNAKIFNDSEINQIKQFAGALLNQRYAAAKNAIIKAKRDSFQF